MLIRPKFYIVDKKCQKDGFALLSDEKIEKREAKIEKWILNNLRIWGKIGQMCARVVEQQL